MGSILPDLEVLPLRAVVRSRGNGTLPGFLNSTLRGALGYALKSSADVQDELGSSPYQRVFEGFPYPARSERLGPTQKNPSPPFLVRCAVNGSQDNPQERLVQIGTLLEFGVALFGFACDELQDVVLAIEQAVEHGLGSERIPFELVGLTALTMHGSTDVNLEADARPVGLPLDLLESARLEPPYILETRTPIQIRRQATVLSKPSADLLSKALAKRVHTLEHLYCQRPRTEIPSPARWWAKWETAERASITRSSARQKRFLELRGTCGRAEIRCQDPRECLPLLLAGSVLGVGHSTTMGLGQFTVLGAESLLSCFGV